MFQTEVAYRVEVQPAPTRGRNQFSAPLRGSVSVSAQRPAADGNHRNQGSQ